MHSILLVEDDFELAMHTLYAFEAVGLRVVHETTVERAIRTLGESEFDVVITDMVIQDEKGELNVFGGLLIVAYAALQKGASPKLIALSGANWQTEYSSALSSLRDFGPSRVLRKPVSAQVLVQRTQELIREKEAEERQLELQKKLQYDLLCTQRSLDKANEPVYWITLEGQISYANEAACQLMGFSQEELLTRSIVDVKARIENIKQFESEWLPMIRQTQGRLFESHILRKDGSLVPVEVSAQLIEFDGEEFISMFARDISDRLREQTVLLRAKEELEQFAYIASHDLKQPLRGIDNLAKWISEDAAEVLSGESMEHLQMLSSRIRRMEALLDDLLLYSRMGSTQCRAETVSVPELVQGVFGIMKASSKFETNYVGDDLTVVTPRIELEQVLRNLVGNAIKHHPSASGKVEVSVSFEEPWLHISVSDDGEGIAPKFQDRVFRMFHTLKTRDEIEGSGMGLAIVRKLVEARGGKITLESVESQGTTFRFQWPAKRLVDAEEPID